MPDIPVQSHPILNKMLSVHTILVKRSSHVISLVSFSFYLAAAIAAR